MKVAIEHEVLTHIGLVSTFVDSVLFYACESSTSDIHIDPRDLFLEIKCRILGSLSVYKRVKSVFKDEIVSRVKILSKIRTDIHDRSQDGRFTYIFKKEKVDMRVSVVPTFYGESVVIRVLRPEFRKDITFEALGFNTSQIKLLTKVLDQARGIILVSGPTGSGKTTTMYSCIQYLLDKDKNIITIEDPVEYVLSGVRQVQVHEQNFTFLDSLRAVLRQDPEVIVIGEIRDTETAQLAFRAALTGHLIIASIHANSALGVSERLLDLHVSKSLLPLVALIIGQELKKVTNEEGIIVGRTGSFDLIAEQHHVIPKN